MPVKHYSTTDKVIRNILLKNLKEQYKNYDSNETAIIPELALPNGIARIDIAVVNGVMHGYELKSDYDTLFRLPFQIDAYNLIFDKVTLVVGKKHTIEAINTIPNWWGVTVAKIQDDTDELKLYPIRKAENNPGQDAYIIASMLWKNEALELLSKKNLNIKKNYSKEIICKNLAKIYEIGELKDHVRQYLVNRFFNSSWRADEVSMPYGD